MGTNYYLKSKPCKECGHSKNSKHIGKSSYGWQFHFRGYREEDIISCRRWLEEMADPNKIIQNEYGEIISLEDFKEMVEDNKVYLNHYNIVANLPMSKLEESYLKDRKHLYPSDDYAKKSWKDDEGHAFTDWEFC